MNSKFLNQSIAKQLVIVVVIWLSLSSSVQAEQAEWQRLTERVRILFQQGQYTEAITNARQAVHEAENTFGEGHVNVATSLNDLAVMLSFQGQYAEAEQLYQHSLSIFEKAFAPDHSNIATTLSNLADVYKAQSKYVQAEPLYQRSLAIFEKNLGTEHPNVATVLLGIAGIYFSQGKYAQAENANSRALAIREKVLGSDDPGVAICLNNLALLNETQGRYAQAEVLYRRSLSIYEKALGSGHPGIANMLSNFGGLYAKMGEYAKAEQFLKRSLEIRENALGSGHPEVAISLVNLADAYRAQGQYTQAEQLYTRALAIIEKTFGPEHPHVAAVLNQLALDYYIQGKYAQVESIFKRALAIREKALGFEHPDVAVSLNNLAGLYTTQGRYALSEPLRKRSLEIQERNFGLEHPAVATNLNDSAYQYFLQEQYSQAEVFYRRSLSIREKIFGAEHPDVGNTLRDLATVYSKQGRYDEALALFSRALIIAEKSFGPDHAEVATILHKQAESYKAQGQYAQAEPLYTRSLSIIEKIVGVDHPGIALSLNSLSEMYATQARYADALALARRASAIARRRIIAGGVDDTALREAYANHAGFFNHLALLARNPENQPAEMIADEALQITQLEQTSGTASAITKMASRIATGDNVLAGLVKRKQDATDRRARDEAQLVKAASKAPGMRIVADESRLSKDIVAMDREIETVNIELARNFPEYRELTRSDPVTVSQVRALLNPDEALLVYALGERSFLWVVRPEGAVFLPINMDAKSIAAKVTILRSEMEFDSAGRPLPVSVNLLHELYQNLFSPALPHLNKARHVMIVPTGALQSLPFSMLVASSPALTKTETDYRQINWLARHYAVSVLPSVGSLQALRQFVKPDTLQQPFAGFGDPLIGNADSKLRGKSARVDVAALFRNLAVSAAADLPEASHSGEIADVNVIRNAARLPETADELRSMAKALGSDEQSIWLQKNATESKVKHLDLTQYRTIAFATHGVMAGEVSGAGEPGLIFTPPQEGSAEDDGYLAASEIAKLKLNADLVVLSACNTAAADGTPGAEGLSGLGKAFFYAGAHSLLVSHWPVESVATVALTTSLLKEYAFNPGLGKAEAHSKSMMALMNMPTHPEYAHPIYWAPFIVVGEGGSVRQDLNTTRGQKK
ncbi:MAG: CHAT domain-containing protein [Gallionella sp.]|nr:CHAT domain-containing protein [Gallionella sp.]